MELEVTRNSSSKRFTIQGNNLVSADETIPFSTEFWGNDGYIIHLNGTSYPVYDVIRGENDVSFTHNGNRYSVSVKDEQALLFEKMGFKTGAKKSEGLLKSPMPGKILDIRFKEGDSVEAGQAVIILEAMKMENELKTATAGTITRIYVHKGESVEKNATLIEIG